MDDGFYQEWINEKMDSMTTGVGVNIIFSFQSQTGHNFLIDW